jgi:hypothetical protein
MSFIFPVMPLNNQHNAAQSSIRRQHSQFLGKSINSPYFTEPEVHSRVHHDPPLAPVLSYMNPANALTSHPSQFIVMIRLRLVLPSGIFPSDPYQNPVRHHLFSQTCHLSSQSHPPWLDHRNNVWWRVKVTKLLGSFLQPFVTSTLGTSVFLSNLCHYEYNFH